MKKLIILIILCLVFNAFSSEQSIKIKTLQFIELLNSNSFESLKPFFNDKMNENNITEKIKIGWTSIIKSNGKLLGISQINVVNQLPFLVECTLNFKTQEFLQSFTFNSEEKITHLQISPKNKPVYKLPEYILSENIIEKEITIGDGKWELPGALTLPKSGKNIPVVILIHGTGPHDRDSSVGPNKPFKDIAFGLASKGIAVLRYEKRTLYCREELKKIYNQVTIRHLGVDDALNAVKFLEQEKLERINKNRIFVLGHSLGGMLSPEIARLSKSIKGIISVAGPTGKFEDIVIQQVKYLSSIDGVISEEEQKGMDLLQKKINRVKSSELSLETSYKLLPLNLPASFWLSIRDYIPAQTASKLNIPIMILHGKRDYQVSLDEFNLWKTLLMNHPDTTFHLYPKLNHLFSEGQGVSSPAEYTIQKNIPEYVIQDISEWILSK